MKQQTVYRWNLQFMSFNDISKNGGAIHPSLLWNLTFGWLIFKTGWLLPKSEIEANAIKTISKVKTQVKVFLSKNPVSYVFHHEQFREGFIEHDLCGYDKIEIFQRDENSMQNLYSRHASKRGSILLCHMQMKDAFI